MEKMPKCTQEVNKDFPESERFHKNADGSVTYHGRVYSRKYNPHPTEGPIVLGDSGELTEEEFGRMREHGPFGDIPFCLGGSSVSTLYGLGHDTPAEYWGQKKGLIKKDPVNQKTQHIFDFGHDAEFLTERLYARKTGFRVGNDTRIFQSPFYEWAVVNLDRFVILPDGTLCILELKTTGHELGPEAWKYGPPPGYELQCRFYMGVMNIDVAYIACFWGNQEEEFVYYRIDRDFEKEREIFETCQKFIDSLDTDEPPEIDPSLGAKAIEVIAKLRAANAEAPAEDLNAVAQELLDYCAIDAELEKLEQKTKELKAARDEIGVSVAKALGTATSGYADTEDGRIWVSFKPSERRSIPVTELKKKAPELYDKVESEGWVKTSVSRPLKVKQPKPKT